MGAPDQLGSTRAAPRTIVVGDVHGCLLELRDLLKACAFETGDRLVFVGDLVAKGPDSQGVVALARELGACAVLGNHDARVLQWKHAVDAGLQPTPLKATHQQVCTALFESDWRWLAALPYFLELPALHAIVVHGGLLSGIAPCDQPPQMMLNARSICADGTLSPCIEDGEPWAAQWTGPQHVLFGHDAVRGLQRYPLATGIDTGCVYGRQLTACILPEHKIVSVAARRAWAPIN